MPEPEQDWVDGIIPPARRWAVRHRYIGHFNGGQFDSADECFATNAVCRRIYARYPIDDDGNPFPLTQPHTGPVRTDLDAAGDAGHRNYENACTDPDAQSVRGDAAGGAGDGDSRIYAHHLRADNRGAGREQDMLLGGRAATTNADADVSAVRDTRAGDALRKGRVSNG